MGGMFARPMPVPDLEPERPATWPRRPVLAAGLLIPWLSAALLVGLKQQGGDEEEEDPTGYFYSNADTAYYAGDAVNPPGVESRLVETLDLPPSSSRDTILEEIVAELEERGGTQIGSSSGSGRWVLPWVGGWQRLWTNSYDASFTGGPASKAFDSFTEIGARQFIYGPGEGGMIVEYLFASGREKYLLSRAASVTNLGDRYFQ